MKEPESFLGNQIVQFRLDRFVAKGAMGMVFEAHDTTLDRKVAIKLVIKNEEGGPSADEVRKRFVQEAKIAGQISHPNIVTVHNYGETDKLQYICMEYVEGKTLSQLLKTRKVMDPETTFLIFEQILSALEAAHQKEFVHRDIKPANIMVTPSGKVKIMDFGIAKTPSLSLTARGMILGTPYYMSPEQISGHPVDSRSDLFSVGAVLYQVLTGYKPFEGETTSTLTYMIVHTDPIPPKDLNERIPPGLCRVIEKAMAKDLDKRYQSPSEMLQDLRSVMRKPPLRSGTASTPGEETQITGAGIHPRDAEAPLELSGETRSVSTDEETPESAESSFPVPTPDAAHGTSEKKASRKGFVIGLCLLVLAGAGTFVLYQALSHTYDIRIRIPTLQRANIIVNDLLGHIRDKILFRYPSKSGTRGTSPSPPVTAPPPPIPSIRLAGPYYVEGSNPDGSKYRGTAVISPSGDRYLMTWHIANRVFSGAGALAGQALTIYWTDSSGRTGVVVYALGPNGVLTGSWADGKGMETLVPVR